jgi:hypothetical protein
VKSYPTGKLKINLSVVHILKLDSTVKLVQDVLVKKISCLRSQDKKAPKFSHLINITGCPFNTSLLKKISRLRSNKFQDETIFLPV